MTETTQGTIRLTDEQYGKWRLVMATIAAQELSKVDRQAIDDTFVASIYPYAVDQARELFPGEWSDKVNAIRAHYAVEAQRNKDVLVEVISSSFSGMYVMPKAIVEIRARMFFYHK